MCGLRSLRLSFRVSRLAVVCDFQDQPAVWLVWASLGKKTRCIRFSSALRALLLVPSGLYVQFLTRFGILITHAAVVSGCCSSYMVNYRLTVCHERFVESQSSGEHRRTQIASAPSRAIPSSRKTALPGAGFIPPRRCVSQDPACGRIGN